MKDEEIEITTNRPGHPLLVKVAYHPRWRAVGADGPWLSSPSLMLVVPREVKSRLVYAGRDGSDHLGLALSGVTLVLWIAYLVRRKAPSALREPVPVIVPDKSPLKWGGVIPGLILVLLVAARFLPTAKPDPALREKLYERATKATERTGSRTRRSTPGTPWTERPRAHCGPSCSAARGEPAARRTRPRSRVRFPGGRGYGGDQPLHRPGPLLGRRAREATGDTLGAAADRQRLLRDQPHTSWAQRLKSEGRIRTGQGSQ